MAVRRRLVWDVRGEGGSYFIGPYTRLREALAFAKRYSRMFGRYAYVSGELTK